MLIAASALTRINAETVTCSRTSNHAVATSATASVDNKKARAAPGSAHNCRRLSTVERDPLSSVCRRCTIWSPKASRRTDEHAVHARLGLLLSIREEGTRLACLRMHATG